MSAQPFHAGRPTPPAVVPATPPDASTAATASQLDRPYPEIPPGPLALRARHWANTLRDLGHVADEVTAMFSRNRWLWVPPWLGCCLIVAACWTTVSPDLTTQWFAGAGPEWAEAAASTFWGRFSLVVASSLPVLATGRVTFFLATKRRGTSCGCGASPILGFPPTTNEDSP